MEVVKRRIAMVAIVMEAVKKVTESQLLKNIVMEVVKRRVTMVAMVAMGTKVVKKINPGTNLWYQQLKNMGTKAAKEKIAMVAIVMEAVKKVTESQLLKNIVMEVVKR